jgi:hypothetical protein
MFGSRVGTEIELGFCLSSILGGLVIKKKKKKDSFYLTIRWGRSNGGENILGPFIIQLIFCFLRQTIFENLVYYY